MSDPLTFDPCCLNVAVLFQKKNRQGDLGHFLNSTFPTHTLIPLEILGFLLYPWKFQQYKTKTYP